MSREVTTSASTLTELFNAQLETLRSRECPKKVLEVLGRKRNSVVARAEMMEIVSGHTAFLTVIPRAVLDVDVQMRMVRYKDKLASNFLDQSFIIDVIEVPDTPYFIFNVEDGELMLDRSMHDAGNLIESDERFTLTTEEVIALAVQTNVLSHHCVGAAGSRYKGAADAPVLYLDSDDKPKLSYEFVDIPHVTWGSPSCSSSLEQERSGR